MLNLILDGLWGTGSAIIFTCTITTIFFISIVIFALSSDKKRQWIVGRAPALLTTLGLFGTFWGVAEGLGHFNASDIDNSVITLLDGMKLAFWTSILGMFYAFLINITHYIVGLGTKSTTAEGIGAQDIYKAILKESDLLKALADAIGSDKGTSLLTQFQKLRTETLDANKELKQSFEDFANKMAENNSNALIDALQKVIQDFNTQINAQFGDNFKQLNEAVGALLTWQENYRTQLEALAHQFQIAQSGITASQEEITRIKEKLASIPETMSNLERTITILDNRIEEGSELLKGFTALQNQASEVFPAIRQGIADLTGQLAASVNQSARVVETSARTMERSTQTQNESIQRLGQQVTDTTLHLQNFLKTSSNDVQAIFKKSAEEIFRKLTEETDKSLDIVTQSMGKKLAAISGKFVDDYQIITENLKKLVGVFNEQLRYKP